MNLQTFTIDRFNTSFSPATGVDPAAWTFLRGVPDVNAGVGDFSTFIRAYTKAQYIMRFGANSIPSGVQSIDEGVQAASNGIARSIVEDVLSYDENGAFDPDKNPTHLLPDIQKIAKNDAQAAAKTLFTDSHIAGWAGNPFLVTLGVTDRYEDNILHHSNPNPDTGDVFSVIAGMKVAAATLGMAATQDLFVDVLSRVMPVSGGNYLNALRIATDTDNFIASSYGLPHSQPSIFTLMWSVLTDIQVDLSTQSSGFSGHNEKNDIIYAGRGNDTIIGSTGNDLIDGGEGGDTISYAGLAHGISMTSKDVPGKLYHQVFSVDKRGFQPTGLDFVYGVENFILTQFNDTVAITNSVSTDLTIDGGGGTDIISNGSGSDTLYGGAR